MQLRAQDLERHLSGRLRPLYVVHGDEPLTALEAGDAIRAAARREGCERTMFVVDPHFRWDAFQAESASLALFGSRMLFDIRIPSGKPGAEGAAVLERHARNLDPENVTLIALPRLDRTTQSSAWFTALARYGVVVTIAPIDRSDLPAWIAGRLSRNGQRASPGTLAFLAGRCEGNLLAARQEIDKLALLLPAGTLDHDEVERAVTDVARFDIRELSCAWLDGDAPRTLRILDGLRGEGEPITLVVWQLAEDLHALAAVHDALHGGQPIAAALRTVRVFGKRQSALESAAQRIDPGDVLPLLSALAELDALAKGLGQRDPWDAAAAIALAVCGHSLPRPLRSAPARAMA